MCDVTNMLIYEYEKLLLIIFIFMGFGNYLASGWEIWLYFNE